MKNDGVFPEKALAAFNSFYKTKWTGEQLYKVVTNMHPAQAEIMGGLPLTASETLAILAGQGTDFEGLANLSHSLGYNLFSLTCVDLDRAADGLRLFNISTTLRTIKQSLLFFHQHNSGNVNRLC